MEKINNYDKCYKKRQSRKGIKRMTVEAEELGRVQWQIELLGKPTEETVFRHDGGEEWDIRISAKQCLIQKNQVKNSSIGASLACSGHSRISIIWWARKIWSEFTVSPITLSEVTTTNFGFCLHMTIKWHFVFL